MTSPSFDSSLATLSNSVFSTQPSLFTSNSLRIHYIVMVRYYYFDEGDQSLQYTNLYMSFRFSTAVPVFIVLSATMNSLNWKKWWVEQRCQISPERYLTIEIGVIDPPNASGKAIGFNAGIWLVQQSIEADKEKITGCRIRDTVGRKISGKDCIVSKENYAPRQVHRCRGVWPKKTLITRLLWRNLSEIAFHQYHSYIAQEL